MRISAMPSGIARETGFESAAYFSRYFHRRLNLAPSQYRRKR